MFKTKNKSTTSEHTKTLASNIRAVAHPLNGTAKDYDPLLELIGDARFVLLGEASHGTHEFYQARAEITRRLIQEKGFTAVAVEADWPDAQRVNRYVRGESSDDEAGAALAGFKRFPSWMWRNSVVLDFVGWMRSHNDGLASDTAKVGFYGLDLYSLYASIEAVIEYLDKVDPEAASRARQRYSCFEDYHEDTQAYGYASSIGLNKSCEGAVVEQLLDVQRHLHEYAHRDGVEAEDDAFFAEQNARLIKDAEEYYRSMFHGRASSWNLRDTHMADTLEALVSYLGRHGGTPKVVIWAHNSHLGDARATEMGRNGELNVGQLVRQRYDGQAVLVGFSTYTGTVTAASDWDKPCERKRVRPALDDSYEALFHEVGVPRFLLPLREVPAHSQSEQFKAVIQGLQEARLERAIGVIYRPDTERQSHYFHAWLPDQFDAMLHFDETRAVEPLERTSRWEGEVPETFPSGV
ncbi:MAG: erythromycin esterase family protein [Abitibacteriaceae bacterium]|nr:erythromycin esterase family protein [Abditibacteriaceae bacterium]